MKLTLAAKSMLLFGLSVLLLVLFTLIESNIGVLSLAVERVITILAFVLPSGAGAVLGVMSLVRKERRTWLALAGIMLNALFAFFHLLIVLWAG